MKRLRVSKEKRDIRRCFTDSQKVEMYLMQDGLCAACKCFLEDFEADHVVEWSCGGLTQTHNGQLLCKDCHKRKSRNDERKK